MLRIKLADPADRERLGIPEEGLEFDSGKLSNREAIALQKQSGWTPAEMAEKLRAGDAEALTAMMWLALRRTGSTVAYDDIEFDLSGITVDDTDDEPAPGKAEAAETSTLEPASTGR